MAKYLPEAPPEVVDRILVDYVFREFNRISDTLLAKPFNFEETFVAVSRPQEGDVAYADGTSWNPGSGRGVYAFLNNAWRKLNVDTTDDITVDDITADTLRLTSTTEATLTSTAHAFQIGADGVANLIADANEVQARNNGVAASFLLNPHGGNVDLSGAGGLIFPQSSGPVPTVEGEGWWDTDDNAQVFGDGSSQKIFRSNNWEFIGLANPSSVASVDFTNLGNYRILKALGRLRPATDAVGFFVRTSTDNGVAFDAGASDYITAYLYQSGATAGATDGTAGTSFNPNVTGIGNVAPEGIAFDLTVYGFNQALQCFFVFVYTMLNGSTATFTGISSGRRASATARNAIRFLFSSGNIADGHIELWGTRGTA